MLLHIYPECSVYSCLIPMSFSLGQTKGLFKQVSQLIQADEKQGRTATPHIRSTHVGPIAPLYIFF